VTNKLNILKQEQCSLGTIALRSDKIITFKPYEDVTEWTVEGLKEMYPIFMDMTGGTPHLYYSDNTNLKNLGSEERVYISSCFHHFASACALKENSAFVRFMTSYIQYINKPKIPIKMFKKEADAINWLKSLKKPFTNVTTCNMKELEEMYAIFMDITGGKPHLYYSDNSNVKSFGADERAYVSSNFHHFASACAIKENSAIVRFLRSYMKHLNKPKINMKMFKKENEAIDWLKSLTFN
jgi:hypothetical protein